MADGRRFELVDDYAHHPRELAATIRAARDGWPQKRLLAIFQPHRYSRTQDLFDDFSEVLNTVDALELTEVYAAGETPIAGADGKSLSRSIRERGKLEPVFISDIRKLSQTLTSIVQDGDLVITMGAGDIGHVCAELKHALATEVQS